MVFIYAVQLEEGKYYIGKTDNPKFHLDTHFNSNDSAWTNLYKPIKVLELLRNCDNSDVDKYTRKYMDKYGINNVRGGSFVSIELEQSTIDYLTQMKNGTNDKCFICEKSGHFAKDCKYNNEDSVNEDSDSDSEYGEDDVCFKFSIGTLCECIIYLRK